MTTFKPATFEDIRPHTFDINRFRQAFIDMTDSMNQLSDSMGHYESVFGRVLADFSMEDQAA